MNVVFFNLTFVFDYQNQSLEPVIPLHRYLSKHKDIVELTRIVTAMWTQQMEVLQQGEGDKLAALRVLNSVLANFISSQPKLLGNEEDLVGVYTKSVLSLAGNLDMEDAITGLTWSLANNISMDSGLKVNLSPDYPE